MEHGMISAEEGQKIVDLEQQNNAAKLKLIQSQFTNESELLKGTISQLEDHIADLQLRNSEL